MAKRLSFDEFRHALESLHIPREILAEYIQMDPESPVPLVVFRPGALSTHVPEDYDLDGAVYNYIVRSEAKTRSIYSSFRGAGRPKVLLEGDSWFQMPDFFRPAEIGDHLKRDQSLDVTNVGHWGDTLASILAEGKFVAVLKDQEPDWLLLSAGGNDLQTALAAGRLVKPFDPALKPEDYLTAEGIKELEGVRDRYLEVFKMAAAARPGIKIVCYGYDYPRPNARGRYIGRHFHALGIPEAAMNSIAKNMIDRYNAAVADAAAKNAGVNYVDCRGLTQDYTWYDDMHPHADGFRVIADRLRHTVG